MAAFIAARSCRGRGGRSSAAIPQICFAVANSAQRRCRAVELAASLTVHARPRRLRSFALRSLWSTSKIRTRAVCSMRASRPGASRRHARANSTPLSPVPRIRTGCQERHFRSSKPRHALFRGWLPAPTARSPPSRWPAIHLRRSWTAALPWSRRGKGSIIYRYPPDRAEPFRFRVASILPTARRFPRLKSGL